MVFMMIVALSAYLLSLRLSWVLEVDTSVGRRCFTIVGENCVARICVFGVWRWGTNLSRTVVPSCLARGNSGLHVVVVALLLVPIGAAAHCFLCFVCAIW